MNIQTVWVYGVGGVGGFVGGKIALFLQKEQRKHMKLYFIARGKHLEEIRKKGLIIRKDTIGNIKPFSNLLILCNSLKSNHNPSPRRGRGQGEAGGRSSFSAMFSCVCRERRMSRFDGPGYPSIS